MRALLLLAAMAASGCNREAPAIPESTTDAGSALDRQAIAAGILPDPANLEFSGRFETRGEAGINKFCAVGDGPKKFRIGVLVVPDAASKCEGRGTALVDRGMVRISLTGNGNCEFIARYDGVELRFPDMIDSQCAEYCTERASLSGTRYFMVQNGDDPARRTLGRDIAGLCN